MRQEHAGTDTLGTPDFRTSQLEETQSACYRIDDLVIDVGRARVTRDETEVALPKLSFDVLLVLVEGAPNLVSIDHLMERVWPGVVVNPETASGAA